MSLSLRNVRTYDALDLDLPEAAVAVVGTNGAGKSTLVNAVDVALFGPESRTLADWLSEDQSEGTLSITLTFEHEGEFYRARRTHNRRGPKFDLEELDVYEDESPDLARFLKYREMNKWRPLTRESMAATQAALEELIGLNRATFRASSFIAAGVMFCDLQPREQKRILGELLQLGQWDGWRDRAAAERRATESDLDRLAGSLERAEEELAGRPEIERELGLAQERAKETKGLLDAAVTGLATAREALAEERVKGERRAGAEKALQEAEATVSTLKAQIEGREAAVRQYDERLADREGLEVLAEGLSGLERERDRLAEQAQGFAERERLEREHSRLMDESEGLGLRVAQLLAQADMAIAGELKHCHACGQTLPDDAATRLAESYRREADELELRNNTIQEAELPDLNGKIGALPAERPDRERAAHVHDLIQQGQHAQQKLAELGEVARHREQALSELDEMRAGLPEREQGLTAARSALEALGPHDPEALDNAEGHVNALEIQDHTHRAALEVNARVVAQAETKLEILNATAEEAERDREKQASLQADLDLYVRMEKACGPNGVPALILEQIAIPQIETAADEILRRFGSKAIGVQLLTQREKKDGGLADTLQVNVLTEYGARDYKTFSTGERLRINAAITLAIAQLVAARSAQTGLLVIDDLGPLDSQGMAVLAEICQELQATVGRVYVISQSPELRDAFETSIEIVSEDGKSRVVGASPTEPIEMEVAR